MSRTNDGNGTPRAGMTEFAQRLTHLWWAPLIAGLVSIGLGLAILSNSWTIKALVVVTGVLFIVRGFTLMFSPSYAADSFAFQVVAGLLGVFAGIALVVWPGPTLLALAVFVGAWLVVSGAFHIVTSIANRHQLPYWGLMVLMGAVEVLLGIWAMRRPEITLVLIIVILGLWAIVTGVLLCVSAFEVRRLGKTVATMATVPPGAPSPGTRVAATPGAPPRGPSAN